MKTLKTLTLIGAASVLALSATAATAQMYDGRHVERSYEGRGYDGRGYDGRAYEGGSYDRGGPVQNIRQRLMQVDRRIDRGIQRGDLNREEAHVARGYYNQVAHRLDMYRVDGFNRWELADLDRRLDSLEARVRYERHDDEYGNGYGYDRR